MDIIPTQEPQTSLFRPGWIAFQATQMSYRLLIALNKDSILKSFYGEWTGMTTILVTQILVMICMTVDELVIHSVKLTFLTFAGTAFLIGMTNLRLCVKTESA